MNMQATGQTITAPRRILSPTERYPMSTPTARTVSAPRWMLRTGWLLSFLVVAQLLSSAWFRATQHTYAVAEIVAGYRYPESALALMVIAECALVVLYLVPQTSVIAAILMTGYLGGAVATHLRVADTARAAIPFVVGILAWGGGLYLRDTASANWFPSDGRREWEFDEMNRTTNMKSRA
jgi:DoxX-like family